MGETLLAVDLYCGLGGWTDGLLAENWFVIGFDIERHVYGEHRYPAQLVIQDVLTLHGSQFRSADLIVASPPCTEFSWMAMPWSRAKQVSRALRGEDEFPANYNGSRTIEQLTELFDACFRIQREACDAAGRHIPMVVENVRGAQKWVGRARFNVGSFYFWGDVPALMPTTRPKKQSGDQSWFFGNYKNSARRFSSYSKERKQWSAEIAKIPIEISTWVAQCFKPIVSSASSTGVATSASLREASADVGTSMLTTLESAA